MNLIELYSEMRDKYGFNEGDTPHNIEITREYLVNMINYGLTKGFTKNSVIEAYPLDRMGVHNWCLIGFRRIKSQKEVEAPNEKVRKILEEASKKYIVKECINIELDPSITDIRDI